MKVHDVVGDVNCLQVIIRLLRTILAGASL